MLHAFIFFWLIYAALVVATNDGSHNWGGDYSHYIAQAKNILEGRPLAETGYIYNPLNYVGPPTYPPMTSVLLAPVYAIWGLNLEALKVPILCALILSLLMMFHYFRCVYGVRDAFYTTILFALTPLVWQLRTAILSEFLYILISFAALWLLWQREQARTDRRLVWVSFASGLLIYLSYATRSIGILLLVSVIVYDLLQFATGRRTARQACLSNVAVFVAFFVPLISQKLVMSDEVGYTDVLSPILSLDVLYFIARNARGYILSLGAMVLPPEGFWRAPTWLRLIMAIGFLAAVTASFVAFSIALRIHWRRISAVRLRFLNPRDFFALLASVRLHEIYFLTYIALVLILPFSGGARYLLPILPFFILYGVKTLFIISDGLGIKRRSVEYLAFASAVALVGLNLLYNPDSDGVHRRSAVELFAFIKNELPESSVIAFRKPRVMALHGERCALHWADPCPYAQVPSGFTERGDGTCQIPWSDSSLVPQYIGSQYLRYVGATHLVLANGPDPHESANALQPNLPIEVFTREKSFRTVFDNRSFKIYELDPMKLMPPPKQWDETWMPKAEKCLKARWLRQAMPQVDTYSN